jgi:hypothetical protein
MYDVWQLKNVEFLVAFGKFVTIAEGGYRGYHPKLSEITGVI